MFDFTSLEKFWNIAEKFVKGGYPTEEDWENFFASKGYKVLTENEFSRKFFIEKITGAVREKTPNDHYTLHFAKALMQRQEIEEFVSSLMKEEEMLTKKAISLALEYLPQNVPKEVPDVSF
ncbi:hypothetical protein DRN32_01210 [Thermococci archaeon]|nr:MAG: hypothetical protein DRN32_01210 [Thermococci archaeon]